MEYAIVAESNPVAGTISGESPVGKALLARGAGDTVEVKTPGGFRRLEILGIN